jgi:hypothetical protein
MNTAGVPDRELQAAEYLESLRSMTGEMERAMQAIAHNALPEFEESVANQQLLSARLGTLANDLCVPLKANAVVAQPDTSFDDELMGQIRGAMATLQNLNRRYAALLQHSSRSVAVMASLFNSFQGQFQEASGPRLKHQTWSCRM